MNTSSNGLTSIGIICLSIVVVSLITVKGCVRSIEIMNLYECDTPTPSYYTPERNQQKDEKQTLKSG